MTDQTKQTKWTPGPWEWNEARGYISDAQGEPIRVVGLVHALGYVRPDDVCFANAALIAAAPATIADMQRIEALARMTGAQGGPLTAEQATALLDAIHGIARAALAKAEGR